MIMQVHDELVFEVASEAVDDVTPRIRERMCGAVDLGGVAGRRGAGTTGTRRIEGGAQYRHTRDDARVIFLTY